MKKVFGLIAIVFIVATLLNACKTPERCPAYGKVNTTQVSKI